MAKIISRQKPVTQRDIAEYCGLRQSSVSYALKGDTQHVPEETIERVLEAARILGYRPEETQWARKMVGRRHQNKTLNHLIAILLPDDFHKSPYSLEPFLGICDALTTSGFNMVTVITSREVEITLESSPVFLRGDIDGLISTIPWDHFSRFVQLIEENTSFGHRPAIEALSIRTGSNRVAIDHVDGGYQAARHLLELKHRHLLFFRALFADDMIQLRLSGVKRALSEYGLDPNIYLHELTLGFGWINKDSQKEHFTPLTITSENSKIIDVELTDYLTHHPEITGLLAWNDDCAINIYNRLTANGIKIPDDISLVGFDDHHSILDKDNYNILTTVNVPYREVGREAAKLLIAQIKEEEDEPQEIILPVKLTVRKSTGENKKS
ncbi:MAG: LacI family DNA-binding transcriptional regulator [bacterium]